MVAGLIANQASYLQEEMARQKHLMAQGLVGGESESDTGNIVAASKSQRLVLNQVSQVAPSRATVLLRGESGTGKELLAEAIHVGSPRNERALVKLNCAALPSDLVESELFGYQKKVPSPVPCSPRKACSNWPTRARSSSTKSASCP